MDKELIEKALENWQNLPDVRCNFCKKVFKSEHDCDYEYLEKRVQELEEELSEATNLYIESCRDEWELLEENKRYRKSIEKAIGEFNYDEHRAGMRELLKALED